MTSQDPLGRNPFDHDPFAGVPFGQSQAGPPIFTPGQVQPDPTQPPANTLATLSVIFAFVFAPAGAVLGHLGLSQIARTRERGRDRALIGVTLSYGIIALTAVALTVWLTTGSTGSTPSSASTDKAAAPVAPSTPEPTSTPPPAPTVAPADVAGLLPSADEMKALTGVNTLTLAKTRTTPATDLDGTADRPNCLAAVELGDARAYDQAALRGYALTSYTDHKFTGPDAVSQSDQLVAAYADAAAAKAALDTMVANWRRCGGGTTTYTTGKTVVPLVFGVPADAGNGITTAKIDWGKIKLMPLILDRAVVAKANILVEVTLTTTTSDRTQVAVSVANAILNRIPG